MKLTAAEIIDRVKFELQYLAKEQAEGMKRLGEDFEHNFAWVGESTFRAAFKTKVLNGLLRQLKEVDIMDQSVLSYEELVESTIKTEIQYRKEFLMKSYNVRENSSGALFRDASTWRFQSIIEMVEIMEKLIK